MAFTGAFQKPVQLLRPMSKLGEELRPLRCEILPGVMMGDKGEELAVLWKGSCNIGW